MMQAPTAIAKWPKKAGVLFSTVSTLKKKFLSLVKNPASFPFLSFFDCVTSKDQSLPMASPLFIDMAELFYKLSESFSSLLRASLSPSQLRLSSPSSIPPLLAIITLVWAFFLVELCQHMKDEYHKHSHQKLTDHNHPVYIHCCVIV